MTCPFCLIIAGHAPAEIVYNTPAVVGFVPLDPVAPGHLLFASTDHVANFAVRPSITAVVMYAASRWASDHGGEWNLITSAGPAATQTIPHLHVHLVPRRPGDGLLLPWTVQQGGAEVREEWAYPVVRRDGGTRWVETWVREPVIPGMARRTVITTPWKAVETGSQQS